MKDFFSCVGSVLLFYLSISGLNAQKRPASLAGEYHMQGVMETASALLLKPDSTFELYFSYGAIDRQGVGKWHAQDGKIVLSSRPKPKVDFALVSSKTTTDTSTTIRILSENSEILPHFEVMVRTANGESYGKTNADGIYRMSKSRVNAIELFFSFCPERYSTFTIQNTDNHFEFKIEPWLTEIFAENITLTVTKAGLTGQHPLLKGEEFVYARLK